MDNKSEVGFESELLEDEIALNKKINHICRGNDKLLEKICFRYQIHPMYVKEILACEKREVHKLKRIGITAQLKDIIDIIVKDE